MLSCDSLRWKSDVLLTPSLFLLTRTCVNNSENITLKYFYAMNLCFHLSSKLILHFVSSYRICSFQLVILITKAVFYWNYSEVICVKFLQCTIWASSQNFCQSVSLGTVCFFNMRLVNNIFKHRGKIQCLSSTVNGKGEAWRSVLWS